MSDRIYEINYRKLVVWLVPQVLRKPRMIAWLTALVSPIIWVYNLFDLFRRAILYKLTITPQVVYLEKLLNDRYDTEQRRIYISDTVEHSAIYVFARLEARPVSTFRKGEADLARQILYRKSETAAVPLDFLINMPDTIVYDQNELGALVDSYKLAGKRFQPNPIKQ